MNAPTLYVIAADLTKMQVIANIDESDVGRMRPGQAVHVPRRRLSDRHVHRPVEQVRLQPAIVQNVVIYSTVIAVPNPELKLKPGMTANVNIEIARRDNVLRVPTAAAAFPSDEAMFTVLNQPVPPKSSAAPEVSRAAAAAADARARAVRAAVLARRVARAREARHPGARHPQARRHQPQPRPRRRRRDRTRRRPPLRRAALGVPNRRNPGVEATARRQPRWRRGRTRWRRTRL